MKRIAMLAISIIFSWSAYSQTVKSSFFHLNDLGTSRSVVRTYKPNEIIASTFSITEQLEMFVFIKDSNIHTYMTVPYGYSINDFVIFNNSIYFCGRNVSLNCGYIGIFDIPATNQSVGAYKLFHVDSVKNLTDIVAYQGPATDAIGIVAIGTPKNTSYKSSVVDLNNYSLSYYPSWNIFIGSTNEEIITDVAMIDPYQVVTVGKSKASSSSSGLVAYNPKLYLRRYKGSCVIGSGLEDILYEYQNVSEPILDGSFLVKSIDDDNFAVASVTTKPGIGHFMPIAYVVNVMNINMFALQINKSQYIPSPKGTLKDLEYFPNRTTIAAVMQDTLNLGHVFFADMTKTANYSTNKISRSNTVFNSITRYSGNSFLISSYVTNLINRSLSFLHEDLNYFKESNCSVDEVVETTASETAITPQTKTSEMDRIEYPINFMSAYPGVYETNLTIDCASYYKSNNQ